jgi:hypothetical protein
MARYPQKGFLYGIFSFVVVPKHGVSNLEEQARVFAHQPLNYILRDFVCRHSRFDQCHLLGQTFAASKVKTWAQEKCSETLLRQYSPPRKRQWNTFRLMFPSLVPPPFAQLCACGALQ